MKFDPQIILNMLIVSGYLKSRSSNQCMRGIIRDFRLVCEIDSEWILRSVGDVPGLLASFVGEGGCRELLATAGMSNMRKEG